MHPEDRDAPQGRRDYKATVQLQKKGELGGGSEAEITNY